MKKAITYLLGLLVFLGCAVFIYGITQACILSWSPDNNNYEIAPFLSNSVISIAAILSTNLGAVLGISLSKSVSRFEDSANWNPARFFTDPNQANIQIIASYIYIIALLGAAVVWVHRDFITDTSNIVPLIPQLSNSLLGVIVGVLAITLNVEQQINNLEIEKPKS